MKTDELLRMVVLDDDPTGIQTVHGCLLVTQWSDQLLEKALTDDVPFFYILTNTRAMTRQEAAQTVRDVTEALLRVNSRLGYRLVLVSRSDSCLRGHFPLETDVMRQVLAEHGAAVVPEVAFCPAFIEAGRVTIDGVHYMKEADRLTPIAETEFARDNVFAYKNSRLADYILEKGASPQDYVVVNAQSYDELNRFAAAGLNAFRDFATAHEGRQTAWVVRSSSSLPKALAGLGPKPLLSRSQLCKTDGVGCFVVGSHVNKTTRQLQRLLAAEGTRGVELDVQRMLSAPKELMEQTLAELQRLSGEGLTPVVYTSRKELRLDDAEARQHLGQTVSNFLVDVVRRLPFTPAYLVAKGGITSHDILTHGLEVSSARVMGQVISSVPCVMTDRFPYVIFPGNVGDDDSLKELFNILAK